MWGLALAFSSTHSCIAFSFILWFMAILALRLERRFSPPPKTYAEICAAPSDHGLLIDPS
jgi:hypothetical protein